MLLTNRCRWRLSPAAAVSDTRCCRSGSSSAAPCCLSPSACPGSNYTRGTNTHREKHERRLRQVRFQMLCCQGVKKKTRSKASIFHTHTHKIHKHIYPSVCSLCFVVCPIFGMMKKKRSNPTGWCAVCDITKGDFSQQLFSAKWIVGLLQQVCFICLHHLEDV